MEDKKTLGSLNNMGIVLHHMEDYEGELAYFQQALRGEEKIFGKTHPDTLMTMMSISTCCTRASPPSGTRRSSRTRPGTSCSACPGFSTRRNEH